MVITIISTITLHVNEINIPIKGHRVAGWIQRQDPYICHLQEAHFRSKDTQTKSEGIDKGISYKWILKKIGIAILISDKIDCKTKTVTRDKEGLSLSIYVYTHIYIWYHYIYIYLYKMIKGSIQEHITIVNMDILNIGAPKYMKQILTNIKEDVNNKHNNSRGL